jgi:glyoxylase-like metal-dependent hydrolase (beta-lactamase superfamily II)
MKLNTIVVGPFEVNCYLYWDEQTRDGVIIDPGLDEHVIIDSVNKSGMTPKAILLTHGHGDHIAAVKPVKEHFDLPLYVGRGDKELLRNPSANVSELIGQPIVAPDPDHLVEDEQTVTIGSLQFTVLATPGHTPGGVCYLDERANLVFTGDSLFWGSIGRTDLPGGSLNTLLDSIKTKLLKLPDGITCYPGHGPKTTIGAEKSQNPFLTGGGFYA